MRYILLTEERSMKIFLEMLLPKIFSNSIDFIIYHHEGKGDLKKSIPIKLKSLSSDETQFLVLIDQDGSDCSILKSEINKLCDVKKDVNYKIRIVCHELESWYFGDLLAIDNAFSTKLSKLKNKQKFRNPDNIINAKRELKRYIGPHGQIEIAEKIADAMTITSVHDNRSHSFHLFLKTIGFIRC